jgi:hypothetical protein
MPATTSPLLALTASDLMCRGAVTILEDTLPHAAPDPLSPGRGSRRHRGRPAAGLPLSGEGAAADRRGRRDLHADPGRLPPARGAARDGRAPHGHLPAAGGSCQGLAGAFRGRACGRGAALHDPRFHGRSGGAPVRPGAGRARCPRPHSYCGRRAAQANRNGVPPRCAGRPGPPRKSRDGRLTGCADLTHPLPSEHAIRTVASARRPGRIDASGTAGTDYADNQKSRHSRCLMMKVVVAQITRAFPGGSEAGLPPERGDAPCPRQPVHCSP